MTLSRFIAPAAAASLFIFGVVDGVAADPRSAELAATCASCHGLHGRRRGIPTLLGISREELARAMADYRSGARSSTIMHAVASSFSDAEIAALARYFAAQHRQSGRQ